LPEVTLLAVTSVALEATVRALTASLRQANFGKTVLLSHCPPATPLDSRIEWREIPPIHSRSDYSLFLMHNLADHVSTSHALCVQWDGYVLNGGAWSRDFLDYDYIGAVWPQFEDERNVGNGGFSLRSHRLLKALADLPYTTGVPEDVLICRTFRETLEEKGLRFATEEVARKFSYERSAPSGREFGFHGAFNLVQKLSPREALGLFWSLESRVLTSSEHKELLRWAISRRNWKFAALIFLRLFRQAMLRVSK
jgi:hypothetical protein